jgi:hypothetical protein
VQIVRCARGLSHPQAVGVIELAFGREAQLRLCALCEFDAQREHVGRRLDQKAAKESKAKQSKAKQSKAKQSKAKQSKAKQIAL